LRPDADAGLREVASTCAQRPLQPLPPFDFYGRIGLRTQLLLRNLARRGPGDAQIGGSRMIEPEDKKRILSFEERISPASTALVVVDVQNDFASPDGVCGIVGDDVSAVPAMVDRLARLIESARKAGVLIVYLRTIYDQPVLSPALAEQYERRHYPNSICLSGTRGAAFVDGIAPRTAPNEIIVTKHRYSAFCGSPLDLVLRSNGIRTLVLTGIATEVCVESTARDGFFQDYPVVLVNDCMSSFSPERHAATLTVVARSFGVISSSEQIRGVWDRTLPGRRNWQPEVKRERALVEIQERLDPRYSALLLINLQNDFLERAGGLNASGKSISRIEAILPRARELLLNGRRLGCMIIHAVACYEPSERYNELPAAAETSRLCAPGSWGARIAGGFEPHGEEQVVLCHRYSAFADTPLALLLRSNGIRSIVAAGVTTECAVESTVRDAASRDFMVVVAADAVATHDANRIQHDASLRVLAGYFAVAEASAEITSRWREHKPLRASA
jgi:nicotinamidase-related amidase